MTRERCDSFAIGRCGCLRGFVQCEKRKGHPGKHRGAELEWTDEQLPPVRGPLTSWLVLGRLCERSALPTLPAPVMVETLAELGELDASSLPDGTEAHVRGQRFRLRRLEIPAAIAESFELQEIKTPDGQVLGFVKDATMPDGTVVGHLVRGGQ